MSDRPAIPPPVGLALAVVSVSFAAPLFKIADAPALTASFWRLAFSVAILLPFALRHARDWLQWSARDVRLAVVSGLALAAHFSLWVSSLAYTSVAASVSLVTLQAIFVALGGQFLLGDRLSGRAWLGVVAATAGAMVIAWGDAAAAVDPTRPLLGDVLAVLGGIGSAAYMLIGRRLRATKGLTEYVVPVYAIAALGVLAALPFVGQPLGGMDGRTFLVFVLLAAVPMIGGHTLANWCFRYMPAHTVATWILLEPAGAALLAWPLLGEVPGPWVVLGGVLVLGGAMQTVRRAPVAEASSVMAAD